MSEVTWFKIFPDGNKCFVVASAGSEPVIALRTIKKDKVTDFLKDYPNAHNIHVANLGEAIPMVTISGLKVGIRNLPQSKSKLLKNSVSI